MITPQPPKPKHPPPEKRDKPKGGYLVVWLSPEEGVTVADHIEIWINKVEGKRVTLAIKAPKDLQIKRVTQTIKE